MDNCLKDKAHDLMMETREDKSIHQLVIKYQSKIEKKFILAKQHVSS